MGQNNEQLHNNPAIIKLQLKKGYELAALCTSQDLKGVTPAKVPAENNLFMFEQHDAFVWVSRRYSQQLWPGSQR